MQVIESIHTPLPSSKHPITLTIGNFDGVHLGHQAILNQLHDTKVVISFLNHPSEILRPDKPIKKICSVSQKIKLLETSNIDFLYLIPFTKEFSHQTPYEFLHSIRSSIPFDSLILGEDATIGKNRSGTQEVIKTLAKEMGFQIHYVKDVEVNKTRPSSSLIRSLIQDGKLDQVKSLLGRPYSIYWGEMENVCLPPPGTYSVNVHNEKATLNIDANNSLNISIPIHPGDELMF